MAHTLRLFLLIVVLKFTFVTSQNTFVPDDNFEQALIDLGYDTGPLDDFVTTVNISSIMEIDISQKSISNLTGIEDFVLLSILDCSENNLNSLDLSNNKNITQLFCYSNTISNLDVSQCNSLNILWCEFNDIKNLDVTSNKNLNTLKCDGNFLSDLNLSQNTVLRDLSCSFNLLSSLDISNNINLSTFLCQSNNLININTNNNKLLSNFNCSSNQLTFIDVSENTMLNKLICFSNKILEIDLKNNLELQEFNCSNNLLKHLDIRNNKELSFLDLSINKLVSLDVSQNQDIVYLDCRQNNLCSLNIKNNNNTIISSFNSKNNPNLKCIFVDNEVFSFSNWTNIDSNSNFVSSVSECNAVGGSLPSVDILSDFVGDSFTLPLLTHGDYFTQANGGGDKLNSGEVITTTQKIYIYAEESCSNNESCFDIIITSKEYFIPKFFTPNNDGTNDFWKVIDTNNSIYSISIYNRYGKLLKFLEGSTMAWDGTFNNKLLPNDSYWYQIMLNNNEVIHGCFVLKR